MKHQCRSAEKSNIIRTDGSEKCRENGTPHFLGRGLIFFCVDFHGNCEPTANFKEGNPAFPGHFFRLFRRAASASGRNDRKSKENSVGPIWPKAVLFNSNE